ncbi:MAG: hypothetical protein ABIK79_03525 [Chloroflexota bacterium]
MLIVMTITLTATTCGPATRPTPTPATAAVSTTTPTPGEKVSKEINAQSGGEVRLADGAKIAIPAGVLDKDATVSAHIVADVPSARDTNLELGIRVYEFSVSGEATFSSPVTITIPYDEKDLPGGVSEDDLEMAYYDELAEEWVPVGGSVDVQKNTISLSTSHLSWWTWVVDRFRTSCLRTENFEIEFLLSGPNAVSGKDYVAALGEALEKAKEKLDGMGFKTRGFYSVQVQPGPMMEPISEGYRVRVVVRDYPGYYGKACPSKLGDNSSWLEIDNNIDLTELGVTAAHEYLHLCQDLYFTNLWWFRGPYLWFNEASALWFEDVVCDTVDGYRVLLDTNNRFILEPLNTNTIDHGYGAASFAKYLAERFGNSIIREIYDQFATQTVTSRDAVRAIEAVIKRHNALPHDVFEDFATRYWTTRDFDEASSWQRPAMEVLTISSDKPSTMFEFELGPLSAKAYSVVLRPGSKGSTAGVVMLKLEGTTNPLHKVKVFCGLRRGAVMTRITPSQEDWAPAGELGGSDTARGRPLRTMRSPPRQNYENPAGEKMWERDMVVLVAVNSDPSPGNTFKGKVEICMPMHMLPDITDLQLRPEDLPGWTVKPPDPQYLRYYAETPNAIGNLWASFPQDAERDIVIGEGAERVVHHVILHMSFDHCCCTADAPKLWEPWPPPTSGDTYQIAFTEGPYVCVIKSSLPFTGQDWAASMNDLIRSGVDAAAAAMKRKIAAALSGAKAKGAFFD